MNYAENKLYDTRQIIPNFSHASCVVRPVSCIFIAFLLLNCLLCTGQDVRTKMLARAASLQLKTEYKAPPGDALSHNTAGYAKIMCSAVFITGLKPEFAAENIGYFTSPYPERARVGKPVIDYDMKSVSIKLPDGITRETPLESWSMGKSLSATLMGILILQGVYSLEQPAPIPQWQGINDGRAKIRIMDIMHMSSGLYCRAPQDPDYDPFLGYPDHLYLYTGGINSFEWAAGLPQQWVPNSVGRYRNSDPVLINYLIRLGIEGKGDEYHTFPQRELFDKIGIRTMVMETDPYGNFLTQGYELASGRDWARLGNP